MSAGPIKDAMSALNRHSDVVELALQGVVSVDADVSKSSIAGLRQASALRAAGHDGFRLHPRLRDYLYDHLQMFPAYQSLTEVGSRIAQLQALWSELEMTRREGDRETLASLNDSLVSAVYDIADSIERNLQFMSGLLSTKYGNVKSLAAKVSQNRFYQRQMEVLAIDVNRLEKAASKIEQEAETRRMPVMAHLLRTALLERSMLWQHALSEMTNVIRRELFQTRQMHQAMRHLARADAFLRQQPSWKGFEAELPEKIPDFLLKAALPRLVAHIEPFDPEPDVRRELEALARALPPRQTSKAEQAPPKRLKLVVDEPKEEVEPALAQAQKALADQVSASRSPDGVSLLQWRETSDAALELEAGVWLVFAIMALRGRGLHVRLLMNGARPGEIESQTFYDALAYARDPLLGPAP
ncbi:MAG: hypothetical protein K0Q43_81 [Ramlibacter sp.]|jgi:hypothetical protein|nr:hypothetical protein [Ramlibacter sp.]